MNQVSQQTRTVIGSHPSPAAPLSLVTLNVHREGPRPGGDLDKALAALEAWILKGYGK